MPSVLEKLFSPEIKFIGGVCLVCSLAVSLTAVFLKPLQDANAKQDMQKNVLMAAGLVDADESDGAKIAELFGKIEVAVVDLEAGREVTGVDPTTIQLKADSRDPEKSMALPGAAAKKAGVPSAPRLVPVYKVKKDGKVALYVLPIWGKGLWSTLWGFVALEADTNTVAGLTYYKHGETPGLGGEVDNPLWKAKWPGRKAYESIPKGDKLPAVALEVVKGSARPPDNPHEVDGLAGATITSRGVSHMLELWLGAEGYGAYLANVRAGKAGPKKAKKAPKKKASKKKASKKSKKSQEDR